MQYYDWNKIAASKGFDDEKMMYLTLLKKYTSKNKMAQAEFPDITNSTLMARMAKLGIKNKLKKSLDTVALESGYISKEDLISSLLEEHNSIRKVAKLLKVSKVRIRQICKQFQIDYDSNVSGVGNYIKAINDDIYLGWDPPCRNCSYQFEDKLDKDKKCWTCGKPQYWHDRTYPEAFTHLFFEHSL